VFWHNTTELGWGYIEGKNEWGERCFITLMRLSTRNLLVVGLKTKPAWYHLLQISLGENPIWPLIRNSMKAICTIVYPAAQSGVNEALK
jgi:hypothetical protein